MLKIKDSVDLKKLEKFGFKEEYEYWVFIEDEPKKNWCGQTINNLIGVSKKDCWEGMLQPFLVRKGTITFSSYSFDNFNAQKTIDKLYDLIQAGLVEKI